MKVLLLSVPRSGSTSLFLGLSKILMLQRIGEPWNKEVSQNNVNITKVPDGCIVKSMIEQLPDNCSLTPVEFYSEYCTLFTHVILLNRRDIVAQEESYLYAVKNSKTSKDWHSRYKIRDKSEMFNYDDEKGIFKSWHSNLESLSKIINVNISWYEDIFSGNSYNFYNTVTSWGLNILPEKLLPYTNPINKYRQL